MRYSNDFYHLPTPSNWAIHLTPFSTKISLSNPKFLGVSGPNRGVSGWESIGLGTAIDPDRFHPLPGHGGCRKNFPSCSFFSLTFFDQVVSPISPPEH